MKSMEKIENMQENGSAIKRIPYFKAIKIAKDSGCSRVMLITTNDNLSALQFYQKRGFDIIRLYHNAVEESRKIKPQIPLIASNGIPIRHEIELEMKL